MAYGKLKVDTITYDNGGTEVDVQVSALAGAGSAAPLNDPDFTGTPTAPTPDSASNDTSLATTAFVVSKTTATETIAQNYTDSAIEADKAWTTGYSPNGSITIGTKYLIDTSSGAHYMELLDSIGSNVQPGDSVTFADRNGTWNTNNFTVKVSTFPTTDRIMGVASDLICNVQYAVVTLIWSGVTTVGWLVK